MNIKLDLKKPLKIMIVGIVGITILCLMIILTGFTIQSPKNKRVTVVFLSPKKVIEKYFEHYNEKNLNLMNSLATEDYQLSKSAFNSLEYIKITNIIECADQGQKEIYLRSREKNKIINFEKEKADLENVVIFKVGFKVKYKENGTLSRESGRKGYNFTLIRKNKSSQWLIDSAGY